ncbi:hypothetical protein [Marinomonas sp. THO17]|uniref:hypothetical protein n=1 Tax=Marinomonas sp. THO17 TaxID=3149048 RepID=UPI00336C0E16
MNQFYVILVLVLLLVYLDTMAIYYAVKTDMFEPFQLAVQALFVIVVPFFGALVVLGFAISQIKSSPIIHSSAGSRSRLLELLFLKSIIAPKNSATANSDNSPSLDISSSGGKEDS